jgi:heterodisulfide reductase subunit C
MQTTKIHVDATLARTIEERSGQSVSTCYQCRKCTAGCPTAYAMDIDPARIVRLVQLGQREELLRSQAIWLCVGCETCGTRCPNQICVGKINDTLKAMMMETGAPAGEANVYQFHQAFLRSIRRFGRVHEVTMLAEYALHAPALLADMGLGIQMFLAGKLPLLPRWIKGRRQVTDLFGKLRPNTGGVAEKQDRA